MTKEDIVSIIAEHLVDPYTDCPEDYECLDPIGIDEAKGILADLKHTEAEIDDPDFRLPKEVTPALVMETFNCLLRKNQYELRVRRLADWLTENESVCEYANYFSNPEEGRKEVLPVDFLYDGKFPFSCPGNEVPNAGDMIEIGMNSKYSFNPNHVYCWFDVEKRQLFSSDQPFHDGAIDAEAFARFILSPAGEECLSELRYGIMDDDEWTQVFGKGE